MENLIQQLKENEKPFGLMSEEMKKKAMELDIADFQYYTSDRNWEAYPAGDFYHDQACRLRPDYEDEPEIEECEIKDTALGNRVYTGDGESEIGIQAACRRINFSGFKFEDGGWYDAPIKPVGPDGKLWSGNITVEDIVSGRVKILHATHVLFRRKKQE